MVPLKQRSIPLCIILSIVTCGIYTLYWMVCVTDELNAVSGHHGDASGGLALVLTLVTCGLYGLYWAYKMGEKVDEFRVYNGQPSGSWAIIYLLLYIFGLAIIDLALIQDNLNRCGPGF